MISMGDYKKETVFTIKIETYSKSFSQEKVKVQILV